MTTILETVAANPQGVRLSRLADTLAAPKSSVFSLVKGLVAGGYLVEDGALYRLGPAVHALLDIDRPSLGHVARPQLTALQAEFDETCMLATQVGDSVVYVATLESTQPIRFSAPLHTRRPLWPTSTGKTLLANMPDRSRDRLVDGLFADAATRQAVREELATVRETGVAYDTDEIHPDVSAVASAIVVDGRAVGSIAIAGPTDRMADKLPHARTQVLNAARQVASKIALSNGHRPH